MVNNTDLVSIIDPFVGEGVQTNSDFLKNMENLQFETSLRLGHFLQVFLEVINFLVYWRTVGFVGIVGFLIYLLFWRPYNRYRVKRFDEKSVNFIVRKFLDFLKFLKRT